MAIKLRRGLEIDRMPIVFAQGEIIYVIDTKKVYIGDGVTFGGNLVTGEELLTALDDVQISSLANNNLLSYNSSLSKWQNKAVTTTDIPEGTNEYHTSARVRAVILTGLSLVTNAVISATDSVLIAFGKLQAQITANLSTLTSHTSNTSNPHATTKAQVGLGNADNTSDANKPISIATQTALDGKVDENTAITGATKTKVTYDSKGLVTAGADATTADIADSTNRRYITDAQLVVVGNTSGTNTGDQTLTGLGGVPTARTLTINGTTQDLSANRTFTIATGITIGTTPITSGAVGRIFFEGTGNVVSESANLFWDNTNGRFGVGQSTPTATLHIQGSSAATTSSSLVIFNSTPTEIFRIRDNGNVQIGTTTDAGFKLDVNGTMRVSSTLYASVFYSTSSSTIIFGYNNENQLFYNNGNLYPRFERALGNNGNISQHWSNLFLTGYAHLVDSVSSLSSYNSSAKLQVDSTTKGFLPPRMTTTQKNAIASPATGLMVYDTTLNLMSVYNGTNWISL